MVFSEGKVRIAEIESYPTFFTPKDMKNVPVWAHVHRLIRLLNVKGEIEAAAYMKNMSSHQRDSVRSLTYRLYQVCDEKKMMEQAKNYNTLAISWGQVVDRSQKPAVPNQATLFEY
jgi:putative DNA methylase